MPHHVYTRIFCILEELRLVVARSKKAQFNAVNASVNGMWQLCLKSKVLKIKAKYCSLSTIVIYSEKINKKSQSEKMFGDAKTKIINYYDSTREKERERERERESECVCVCVSE